MKKIASRAAMRTPPRAICNLQGFDFHSPEELAERLRGDNVRFTGRELATYGRLLGTRFPGKSAACVPPEWLIAAIGELIGDTKIEKLCDPWAGIGLMTGALLELKAARSAVAYTLNPGEMELGKVLVPSVEWVLGDPVERLLHSRLTWDVIASILPMNVRARRSTDFVLPSGGALSVRGDVSDQLIIASSLRLNPTGLALFVVPPSFFFSEGSVSRRLEEFGMGIEAVFALPSGTFAPYTNISTNLIVVRKKSTSRMFVAQLTADTSANIRVIENFRRGVVGESIQFGTFVEPDSFKNFDHLRAVEALRHAEKRFGAKASTLAELADLKSRIKLGRPGDEFSFQHVENAIYIPLIGSSSVVESPAELTLKPQNYAQVVIDPARSDAHFVAQFLNSDFGKELREQFKTGFIPRLTTQTLGDVCVLVPDQRTQRQMVEVEAMITAEQNTIAALQNEIAELRRQLWTNPSSAQQVADRTRALSQRLSGEIKQHTAEKLDQWLETLPFPLASILRAWQASPSQDYKRKYEHLLHFFEGAAQFISLIFLSAYCSNEAIFDPHRQALVTSLQKQGLSFDRATFGTWKLVVEYLGKQVRSLLREDGKKPADSKSDRALCGDLFADPSLALPNALSRKEVAAVVSATNKLRNDWSGHGGVVGDEEAELRNQLLVAELQKLRDAMGDVWTETQLVRANHCRLRAGIFETDLAIVMGSNSQFLQEMRRIATSLDVEHLYLSRKDSTRSLKLLPLIQVGPSPLSAKNACYFFNRLETAGARLISFHFAEKPELTGPFPEIAEAIKLLKAVPACP